MILPTVGGPTRLFSILALALVGTALAGTAWGCGDDPAAPGTISRDTFVAAYADLRLARTGNPNNPLPPATRDRVLSEHGVSAEDLVTFVEVHGADLEFMTGVWEEIDRRVSGPRDGDGGRGGGEGPG